MARLVSRLFIGILTVLLATAVCFAAPASEPAAQAPTKATAKKTRKKSPSKKKLLDINTATADQLATLPGMSKEDAKKIIAGRPYTRKNQLKQKDIISAATYDGIKKKIVAKRVKK
ncbi:MAG TPA: helix-hairpin-helix domain-containing protein [Geobacteraceae bacterium]|nr:helix-hairpin-helix domain-containing protein [Geobacteraceae bacterium]